jgi:hypothetical protein
MAAGKAGMHRNTARRYRDAGRLPSQLKMDRTWRTRADPFQEHWEVVAAMLEQAPELEGKALFAYLMEQHPGVYHEGQLRTFQRRVRRWRAEHGPPKEVFFAQCHRPGEAMQTDFTRANELEVTIAGEAFPHLLCHSALPYSNWTSAVAVRSESMAALRRGIQAALLRLGRVPQYSQTDNSTAATHDLGQRKRCFNKEYEALVGHFGMRPRTTAVGAKEQNGDIESLNGALKRRLKQHLLLRGSRDFVSREDYEAWLWDVCSQANRLREPRLREELVVMRPLAVSRLAEYSEQRLVVSSWSTIRVRHNTYSVPSRLIGEEIVVRVYEECLEIRYANKSQLTVERLVGKGGSRIDYRHLIWSLVKKPGAFARYRFREELFPSLIFRKTYDRLLDCRAPDRADLEYLRILHLAAATMESEVEAALELLLLDGRQPSYEAVRELVAPARPEVPAVTIEEVELGEYDGLLSLESAS